MEFSQNSSLPLLEPEMEMEWTESQCFWSKRAWLELNAKKWNAKVCGVLEPPILSLKTFKFQLKILLENKEKDLNILCQISTMKDLD